MSNPFRDRAVNTAPTIEQVVIVDAHERELVTRVLGEWRGACISPGSLLVESR